MIELLIPVAGIGVGVSAVKMNAGRKIRQFRINRNMEPEFQKLRELLSRDPNSPAGGEVMVRFDSGKEVPFHQHDTVIDDQNKLIEKEAADGQVWYSGNKIEAVWIHKEELDDI